MAATRSPTSGGRRLRVGYLSTAFCSSPGARFFRPVLEHHDPLVVQTYLYHAAPRSDEETDWFRQRADFWRDVAGASNRNVAECLEADRLDVLVDLDGHSVGSRLSVFAWRPAPVQISYHGAFSSSGLAAMDYRIADRVLCPPGEIPSGPEQVLRLRSCFYSYCPWPEAPPVAPAPCEKNGFVTFGALHRVQKWTPLVLDLWCRVVKAVPGSKILVNAHDAAKYGLTDPAGPFEQRGVWRKRVIVPPRAATTAEYLRLFERVDIFLDAFPFSGATTVCDSLWQGVPVVAIRGKSFLGRMSASILEGASCSGWVARSANHYVDIARAMALDSHGLAYQRNCLRTKLRLSPLLDGARLARELERVYCDAWEWHQCSAAFGQS